MTRFKAALCEIEGPLLIEGKSFPDERGFFLESFRAEDMLALGVGPFVQDNSSRSMRGTLRGLHYQKPSWAVGKLVRCVRGRVFDVAVDLRRRSKNFGRWVSVELSDEGNRMFWIPPGFAHGFQALSDWADVSYKVTGYWSAEADAGIRWDDPDIAIDWPHRPPLVSPKDARLPLLSQADPGF
jgi:dTDP-4-dehydrorhamnose 3,5-epimerase